MPHASAGSLLPLSRFPALAIGSLDEASELYSRMTAPVLIHGIPGKERFSWRMNHLELGPLALAASETTSSVWADCEGAEDAYLISIPLGDHAAESSIGKLVTPLVRGRMGLLYPPGQRSKVVIRSGFQTLQISLPRVAVIDAMATLTGRDPIDDVRFRPRLALDAPDLASFSRFLGGVLKEADRERPDFAVPGAAGRWAEGLIFRLLLGQPNARSALLSVAPSPGEPRHVRRAAEYLDVHADRHVTLGELTRVTGVSARSLQLGFQKHRGCSPLEFARSRQLERARVLLLTSDDELSVSEVAQRVGIAHLGRFSVGYGQRFGETPTHTRARRAGLRATRTDRQ